MSRNDSVKWLKVLTYVGIYGGLLMPLIFVPKVIFPFVFSKLLYFQIVIGLTFPAYLVLAWMEPKYRPRWTPLYSAIAAYFVALLLSVIFAVDPWRAWWGNQERMNGLFTIMHFFVWFSMMISMLKTWEQWRKILLFEIALSVFMAVVALLQIPFPKLLTFQAGPRVGGLLDNPIYMAAYQIFNLFFIGMIWLKGASRNLKIWLALAAVVDIGAFLAAQSRGALVGLGVGVLVFAITYAILTTNKKAKITVFALAVLAFASYGALYAFRDTDIIKSSPLYRLTNLQATTQTRFIAWQIAWQGFLERPLTGWGFDDFHILFNEKYNPESLRFGYYETWFDRAHNTVMDVLSMTGLFGFITFAAIYISLYYSVIRAYRKRWIDVPVTSVFIALPAAYFVQNLLVFDQPAGFVMSFFMFALIARATSAEFIGVRAESKPVDKTEQKTTLRQVPWIAFGVLQVAAVILVWRYSFLPAKASVYSIDSNNYFSAGILPEAYRYAKLAADIPTPYLDEQTFLQSRNLISLMDNGSLTKFPQWKEWHDLIVDTTEAHLKDHPNNTHPHFIYARFLHAMSKVVPEDAAKAEEHYKIAIKTSPKRQQLYYSLGRFYLERSQKDQAYDLFKQAADFDHEVGESHWYLGLTLTYDFNKAEEGAKELTLSSKVSSPYNPSQVREAVPLAQAYVVTGEKDLMRNLIKNLPNMSNGDVKMYMEIARCAERLGMTDERNLLLGAIERIDSELPPRLAPLHMGMATSIDMSLQMTASMENPAAVTSTATSTTMTTTTTAQVATTSRSAASGPRK